VRWTYSDDNRQALCASSTGGTLWAFIRRFAEGQRPFRHLAAVLCSVAHEGLPGSFTSELGLIRSPLRGFKQVRISPCLADKLFCIRVVAQCEDVEVQQAILFLAIHRCGDHVTLFGGRLPSKVQGTMEAFPLDRAGCILPPPQKELRYGHRPGPRELNYDPGPVRSAGPAVPGGWLVKAVFSADARERL
jgi:hypothetical protein